jgi:phenylacetic acid degradation operon negative regulatory protein
MKRTAQIGAWIGKFLASDPPRAKSLVVTIFGDSIAPHGDSIWLQSLIDLLRPFGVNERLVRSSVFRLVEEEWLVAERHGRQSRYAFTASGRKRFERAHDKIYFGAHRRWNGEWTLLIAPPALIPSGRRVLLRRELAWEGFRLISPGTFAHPAGDRRALDEILERAKVRDHVVVCSARDTDSIGAHSLRSLVARHWELAAVLRGYQTFIDRLRPLIGWMPRAHGVAPEQAFVIRTLVIHAFRRVLLHDPLLPVELLPDEWPGRKAYDLCRSVYQLTYRDAEQYVLSVLGPAAVPQPAPYFQERFGGLPPPPARVPSDTVSLLTT